MPVVFLQLARNRQYWRSAALPGHRRPVSPSRAARSCSSTSPGAGLQLHPLSTFKKANLIHGACVREEPGCDPAALARLLDEMERLARAPRPRASSPGSTSSTSAAERRRG